MAKTRGKRIRLTAEESQNRIITESLKLIGKRGWSELSFQMIAEKCQMSQSNVLYHFPSRVDLLKALLEKVAQRNFMMVAEAISPEHNALQRIVLHFEKNIEWGTKFPEEAQIVLTIYAEACHSEEFCDIFDDMILRAQSRIREHILAGIREQIFDPSLDDRSAAKLLHNVLVGAFINIVSGRKTGKQKYTSEEFEDVIKKVLGRTPAKR